MSVLQGMEPCVVNLAFKLDSRLTEVLVYIRPAMRKHFSNKAQRNGMQLVTACADFSKSKR